MDHDLFTQIYQKYAKQVFRFLLILLVPFLPTALALVGKRIVVREKKSPERKLLSRIIFAGTIPAILLGAVFSLVFMILPPLASVTQNPSHYMKLDGSMDSFNRAAGDFFPVKVPEQAEQVSYEYERYSAIFSDRSRLEASWVLPQKEYEEVKEQTMEMKQFQKSSVSESGENGVMINTVYPEGVTVSFEYNDKSRRVIYRAYSEKNH